MRTVIVPLALMEVVRAKDRSSTLLPTLPRARANRIGRVTRNCSLFSMGAGDPRLAKYLRWAVGRAGVFLALGGLLGERRRLFTVVHSSSVRMGSPNAVNWRSGLGRADVLVRFRMSVMLEGFPPFLFLDGWGGGGEGLCAGAAGLVGAGGGDVGGHGLNFLGECLDGEVGFANHGD